jgi:hypothetical protein
MFRNMELVSSDSGKPRSSRRWKWHHSFWVQQDHKRMEQKKSYPKPRNTLQTVERISLFPRWLAKPSMDQGHESYLGLKFLQAAIHIVPSSFCRSGHVRRDPETAIRFSRLADGPKFRSEYCVERGRGSNRRNLTAAAF